VPNHCLTLPERTSKPRHHGRTQLLDKGLGVAHVADELETSGVYADLVKFGWGTSVITPNLTEKIAAYRRFDIEVSFGGTLFELYFIQNKLDDYAAWLKDLGVETVEISDGAIQMDLPTKIALIERFSRDFRVLSEVGSKDETVVVSPQAWVRAIKAELAAGAKYVILEGRESGTTGMYRSTGEIRMGLIQDILESGIEAERIIFETPNKAQQVYMIKLLGPNVNLGNIAPGDVVALETLRQGLRADTLLHSHGKPSA
jgi:phosphosulfolactate synthase